MDVRRVVEMKTSQEDRDGLRRVCEDDQRQDSPMLGFSRRFDKMLKPLILGLLDDLEESQTWVGELELQVRALKILLGPAK